MVSVSSAICSYYLQRFYIIKRTIFQNEPLYAFVVPSKYDKVREAGLDFSSFYDLLSYLIACLLHLYNNVCEARRQNPSLWPRRTHVEHRQCTTTRSIVNGYFALDATGAR
jgi:hypothetical protein